MYKAESIDAVRSLDIVSVVGRLIPLDKHNKACCPFHNEKTPSFSVSKVKQIFKCYGCGEGGDLISFVKRKNSCDFIEAIEIIAELEGVVLEQDDKFNLESYQKLRAERKTLRQVLIQAHDRYKQQLYLPENSDALRYWMKRGYSNDVISAWGLGYAPYILTLLTRSFTTDGSLPEAIKLGLIKEKDNKLHQDVFVNRVIIPIVDEQGELVTFAGRITDDGSKYPKYINGAISPLYNKSKTLFGLYQAIPAIKEHKYAILTEGYTDVISMHTAGATNTVAACGTALTEDMARLLKRYTSHVVLMRDGDKAGENAEDKDLAVLLKLGFKVDIFPLEDGKDPDNFSRPYMVEFNEDEFLEMEPSAQDLVDDDQSSDGITSHIAPVFLEIARFVVNSKIASTSMLQLNFNLGYNRANAIMGDLEAAGVVGPHRGLAPRELLITDERDLDRLFNKAKIEL